MREGIISMTPKELRKHKIIEEVIEKDMKQKHAAELLQLSIRQIRRLVKRVRKEGVKGVIHALRGRESNRKHSEGFRQEVLKAYEKEYMDFGPTLAQEKLKERNKIRIGRETLRQLLIEKRLWESQRKGQKHLEWRQRRGRFGEMIQVDGSHHDWLEGRGPWLVLMGYIDDATGEVFAGFYDYEGTLPAMESFYGYAQTHELPHSIYIDRLGAYKGRGQLSVGEELAGKTRKKSQFERALEELGVEVIHAWSAQAKGRVERLFRTLQDRLVKEMRLVGIKTKQEANQFLRCYLPKYNQRFCVEARVGGNLHRAVPTSKQMKQILSIQTQRVVRNDGTIRHEKKLYQLLNLEKRIKQIMVEERMDGKVYMTREGRELEYRELQEPVKRVVQAGKKLWKPSIPTMTHPWKGASYRGMIAKKLQTAKMAA